MMLEIQKKRSLPGTTWQRAPVTQLPCANLVQHMWSYNVTHIPIFIPASWGNTQKYFHQDFILQYDPPHYKAMWHHLCCGDTLKIFFLVTVTYCIYKHLVIRVENDLSKCLKIIFKLYLHLFGKAADSIDYWVINVFKNKVLSQTLLPYLILYIIFKYWWITNNTISFFCIYNSQLESFS